MRALAVVVLLALLAPAAAGQVPPVDRTDPTASMERDRLGAALVALEEAHPDLVRVTVLGTSVRGLDLWRVDVANFTDPAWESHPALLVDGGHHGNEFSGVYAAWYFLEDLVAEAAADPTVLAGKRVVVIPTVNPDGWLLTWRSNANGVNLNRNYPYGFDERGTGAAPNPYGNYAGPSAASEPETKLVMAAMEDVDLRAYVSYHCCGPEPGGELVLPWDPENDAPIPDWDVYARLLAAAEQAGVEEYRPPSALGESIAHAYGNLGAIAVLPETPAAANPRQEDAARREELREMLAVPRIALEHLLDLGARLDVRLDGDEIVVRNDGWGTAYGVVVGDAALGDLAPGAEARAPGGCADVAYRRLAVEAPERAPTSVLRVAGLPACAAGGDVAVVPGAGALALVVAAIGLALVRAPRRP